MWREIVPKGSGLGFPHCVAKPHGVVLYFSCTGHIYPLMMNEGLQEGALWGRAPCVLDTYKT